MLPNHTFTCFDCRKIRRAPAGVRPRCPVCRIEMLNTGPLGLRPRETAAWRKSKIDYYERVRSSRMWSQDLGVKRPLQNERRETMAEYRDAVSKAGKRKYRRAARSFATSLKSRGWLW